MKPVEIIPSIANVIPERLIVAAFVAPETITLEFADGLHASLDITFLEIPLDRVRWETIAVADSGDKVILKGVKGDLIPIDATTFRYLVDKEYADRIDRSLDALQLSRHELAKMASDNPPPPEWYEEPERDLTRESWK